ncbi:hypothetical protein K466DRAFT_318835 [Polyporus arcularius HHB13444]|uniref:C2H2-type domain-containing protein n=1 Tax=Polyporus arcularius HHB13444 TaxID=1314778 RepID=A0A5C3NXW8_9APHY|nr:hypothetical protein K466DRAFT_318835 [Polyporus arcularius HHB13444]
MCILDREPRSCKPAPPRAAPYYIPPRSHSRSSSATTSATASECGFDSETKHSCSPSPSPDDRGFAEAVAALPSRPADERRRRRAEEELKHMRRTDMKGPKSKNMCRIGAIPCRDLLLAEDIEETRKHIRSHWKDKEGPFVCQGRSTKGGRPCTRDFTTLPELVKHFETHLYWAYWCAVCEKGYSRLDALERHKKTLIHKKNEGRRRRNARKARRC